MKFGISPFGIWRPKNPPQIQGMDAYAEIYADSRKWLAKGWLDYFAPQLYWPIAKKRTKFFRTARLVGRTKHRKGPSREAGIGGI